MTAHRRKGSERAGAVDKMHVTQKTNAILDRIRHYEEAIAKAREYLETGKHAHWHGFRPLFIAKARDGEAMPPHKDWVTNVFLPQKERELKQAQRSLSRQRRPGRPS